MTNVLPPGLAACLLWAPELGLGYHSMPPQDYNHDYFAKYIEMDESPMGAALTRIRIAMVQRHHDGGDLVDIGIGGGRFCREANVYGFDVNPAAVQWLHDNKRYRNPYQQPVESITCWDSLEHIQHPEALLACVRKWVFVSLPIFQNEKDCLGSKHYKPGEHIWYFTHAGFIAWAERQGFEMVEFNSLETKEGRESINSYALSRKRR